jgi:hypothetical protein
LEILLKTSLKRQLPVIFVSGSWIFYGSMGKRKLSVPRRNVYTTYNLILEI